MAKIGKTLIKPIFLVQLLLRKMGFNVMVILEVKYISLFMLFLILCYFQQPEHCCIRLLGKYEIILHTICLIITLGWCFDETEII